MEFISAGSSFDGLNDNDFIKYDDLQWDEETWLYECPKKSSIVNLHKWLYNIDNSYDVKTVQKSDYHKIIDTRTFTRPKKRYTRPSIEKYNEELYGNENDDESSSSPLSSPRKLTDSGISVNGINQEEAASKPLNFDLTLPTNVYFDNILTNAPSIESFQNMSPPSLVNSLCSSTFANLMENSFIKNDPVLREIRDTDYTESVLMQESEPMFQSMSESISSLNSDIPENFLKKLSFNETFRKNPNLDVTFSKEDADESSDPLDYDEKPEKTLIAATNNAVYKLSNIDNKTFEINPQQHNKDNANIILNTTIILDKSNKSEQNEDLNATVILARTTTISPTVTPPEKPTRLLNRRERPSLDLNRLSYCIENKHEKLNTTFVSEEKKLSSLSGSTDSENMDYMSISSTSSKGSNKMLNMDGINAIVEMQERSLQVMSTPRSNHVIRKDHLWENNMFSPITSGNSDPELSSNSSERGRITPPHYTKAKVVGSRLQQVAQNIRSSHPNLKLMDGNLRSSQTNLQQKNVRKTNLNTMGCNLKGSYTSLKPISANLPVAPPLVTAPKQRQNNVYVDHAKESVAKGNNTFIKVTQPPRTSGLPRPVGTGIPRPASRIPGPKSVRSIPKPAGQFGRK